MSLLESILMGFIQGVTEFLPVSSSGHLAIFKQLFQIEEPGMFFDVLLHIGTLLAVIAVYYKDIGKLIVEGCCIVRDACVNIGIFFGNVRSSDKAAYRRVINSNYRKFVMLVIVSTIPTGVVGIASKELVEMAGQILVVPGICLILTAILLFVSDYASDGWKVPKNVTYTNAFIIGICQGIATLPGISRSGMTIAVCLLSGFNRRFAVKYSFIMSIPAILGALILQIKDVDFSLITGNDVINYVVGTVVAAVVGYICIKTMLVVVRNKKFIIFSIYCLIVGAVCIGSYFYLA